MAKKAIVLLIAAFAVFYLLSAPQGAADALKGAASAVQDAFGQLITFFNRLFA